MLRVPGGVGVQMGRGPHKPTQLRALEGGRSHSLEKPEDLLAKEPKPRAVNPDPPKELSTQAKKIWKKLAPRMSQLGLLTEVDLALFGVLCNEQALILKCLKELKEPELFQGHEKQGRILEIYRKASADLLKVSKEFGLTPRGRVGLVVGGAEEGGAGADLLT